jgi:hypothetical protein
VRFDRHGQLQGVGEGKHAYQKITLVLPHAYDCPAGIFVIFRSASWSSGGSWHAKHEPGESTRQTGQMQAAGSPLRMWAGQCYPHTDWKRGRRTARSQAAPLQLLLRLPGGYHRREGAKRLAPRAGAIATPILARQLPPSLSQEVLHAGRDFSRVSHLFPQRCRHRLSLDAVTAQRQEDDP